MSKDSGIRWAAQHPERAREYRAAWQKANPDRVRAIVRRAATKRRALMDDLKDKPCMDCGIKYPPYIMDFDHRDSATKKLLIGQGFRQKLDRVLLEVDKCDVVCSNCHRERTHQRKNEEN